MAVVSLLFLLPAFSLEADDISTSQSEPLRLPDSALEPIDWSALDRWVVDDHAAAFAAFLASCRPLLRTSPPEGEKRPMLLALRRVCRQALAAGRLAEEQARMFFERNFRPLRITKLGDNSGFLTGYYEPIVDGSRFPTGIFKVPIYRRPPDLVPPLNSTGRGFPNRGQSLRRTSSGALVPYYDRGEILDGALDGQHLEICWIKNQMDALVIQIQGSARVRLEDGAMLRINYDAHNGYPFVPVGRILIERNIIPREEMSLERIREWMRADPQGAEEALRQNRSFVFFRIVGLSDDRQPVGAQGPPHDREAVGAQGIPLTPGRSIAVDNSLHVYGTPFFIHAGLPLTSEKRTASFDRLVIAQDTGSAIVGPARADIYFGAGDQAGHVAGRLHHHGNFAMLVPVSSTLSQRGRGCPFRRKGRHLLCRPAQRLHRRNRPAGRLDQGLELIRRNPDTQIIVDHLGLVQPHEPPVPVEPWAELPKVLTLAKQRHVAMKISGACTLSREQFPYTDIWDSVCRVIDAFGIDRCMWGTDWTRAVKFLSYAQAVEAFRVTERISQSDKVKLMGGTLARIYGWSPRQT